MRLTSIITIIILNTLSCFGQQDAQYTQYMYNTVNVNPAYAGNRGKTGIFGLHRTQWVGLDGAPTTNVLAVNSPIYDTNLGVGLSAVNDRIGAAEETTISADVSYAIRTSDSYRLSFGLKASADILSVDYNKLTIYNTSNANLEENINNKFMPNLGGGIYFNSDRLYVGFSVLNLFASKKYDDNLWATVDQKLHYYFIGGYVFDVNPKLKFKPAFMTKTVQGAPLQLDLSGNFMYDEKFVLGAAWRWNASVSALAGFQISDGMFLGYAYDFETSELKHYSSGSHELFLRFEFRGKQDKIVSPRFF